MTINLNIPDEMADRIVVETLKQSMARAQRVADGDEYTKQYVAACRLVIEHFGGNIIGYNIIG